MESLPVQHPVASAHLPFFITAPGQTDMLLNIVVVFLILMILLTGVIYLRLHALPDRMMHGRNAAQYQIVAVLALISLLSQNHVFWIAALLLAMIDVPSLFSPLSSMASSLARISRNVSQSHASEVAAEAAAPAPAPVVPIVDTPPAPQASSAVATTAPQPEEKT